MSSTKKTSKALIERLAKERKKSIQMIEIDCSICWQWFEKEDMERYEVEIANQIKLQTEHIEVVFLAQASMEGAKKYLTNEKYEVVSSPEFGVKRYLEKVEMI